MENSKWVKIAPKEEILRLKEQEGFNFTIPNLCEYFDIPDRRMGELLKFYGVEVMKLTKNIRLTTEEWKKDCSLIHNNYYDYSKSIYVNSKTLITIGCPIHGDVQVNPNRHKNGSHCKRCSAKKYTIFKSIDKETYFREANETHNYKYDYSLSEDFETVHDKISIICPQHGVFKQTAHSHRKGSGCEKCSYEERGETKRVPFNEYLKRANDKFNGLYKYLEDSYTTINGNITYICEIHGEVSQKAETHLRSKGCNKCFSKNIKHTTDSFVKKSSEVHNNFYDYSLTIYGNRNTDKVIITCPFHGDFLQAPMGHLSGQGCKICANIKSNIGQGGLSKEDIENSKNIPCAFYLLKLTSNEIEYYKIGISTNMKDRLTKLSGAHKANIEVLYIVNSNLFDCAKLEGDLLNKYKEYNKKGEVPFKIEGSTECLSINTPIEEILSYLEQL